MSKLISNTNLKNIAITFGIAIFFMADRGLKIFAQSLGQDNYFHLINNLFTFRFTPNKYISFSLPVTGIILNITISLIVIALIYYIFHLIFHPDDESLAPARKKTLIIWLTLILFGAISNLQDRLFYGYVIDYLELRYFTVFNLADAMITIGTASLIFLNIKKNK